MARLRDQNVLWFQVAVDQVGGVVEVVHRLDDLRSSGEKGTTSAR